ncbi:MAG: hypothetical protein IPP31_12140 [Chitinophagaceae bacterium]|nr:hypothetical protein [Chitinophagaceae bacterium]
MKSMILLLTFIATSFLAPAQILNKIKNKVSGGDKKTNESNAPVSQKDLWCKSDTITGIYDKVYASSGRISILYDESCLGLGSDGQGYSIVLSERNGNVTEYVVIVNGKETGRYREMKNEYLPCHSAAVASANQNRYIIADSTRVSVPATQAQKVTTKSIDVQRAQQGMELAKQTDEYKKLSPEEKKQFDEMMKNMPGMANEYNQNLANKTYEIPGQQGVSGAYVSGYRVVVNRKEYGKFSTPPQLLVSPDEKNVFILGYDLKAGLVFQVNDKKTALQQKGFNGSGKLIAYAAGNKALYTEMKQKTAAEMEQDMKDYENIQYTYRFLKADGGLTELKVAANSSVDDFKVTAGGSIVYVNPKTGDILVDGKKQGQFPLNRNDPDALRAGNILMGDSPDKICYYSSDGSLNYPNGSKKELGAIRPAVNTINGRSVISWFRLCGNEVYRGKMSF